MNISKIVALAAATLTVSISTPVAAQELREGQVVTRACTYIPGHGIAAETVRGVRVQTGNGQWAIAQQIVSIRTCRRQPPPPPPEFVVLPDIRTIATGPQPGPVQACSGGYIVDISTDDKRNLLDARCVSA